MLSFVFVIFAAGNFEQVFYEMEISWLTSAKAQLWTVSVFLILYLKCLWKSNLNVKMFNLSGCGDPAGGSSQKKTFFPLKKSVIIKFRSESFRRQTSQKLFLMNWKFGLKNDKFWKFFKVKLELGLCPKRRPQVDPKGLKSVEVFLLFCPLCGLPAASRESRGWWESDSSSPPSCMT